MSVDGTIELQRLENVLYVSTRRRTGKQPVMLFKISADGKGANRVP
jgi:hypothetical protein